MNVSRAFGWIKKGQDMNIALTPEYGYLDAGKDHKPRRICHCFNLVYPSPGVVVRNGKPIQPRLLGTGYQLFGGCSQMLVIVLERRCVKVEVNSPPQETSRVCGH